MIRRRTTDPALPAPDGTGLAVTGLNVAYDTAAGPAQVLHDITFSVAPGEIFGLVGESGCGKSTLAYALAHHLAPGGRLLDGTVRVGGTDILTLDPGDLRRWRARRLAFVHQDAAGSLDPTMRIGAQLDEILRHRGLSRAQASARTLELLTQVRLPDPRSLVRRYPHQLSGGQQQRVGIAAALAVEPHLLVLDEPTTGLDASVEHEVLTLLAELRHRLSAAVVFVSHDLGLVERLCDRVGVLYAGRLVEVGAVGPVLGAPAHPYTSALLAAVPRLGARRSDHPLRPIPGSLPAPGAAGAGCAFAPRCPRAEEACEAGEPPLMWAGEQGVLAVAGRTAARASGPAPAVPSAGTERLVRCLHPGPGPESAALPAQLAAPRPVQLPAPRPAARPAAVGPVLLEIRGLVRSYGRAVAVDHVDLTIRQGEVLGLVGESGSGKSTLARAVAGLGSGGSGELRLGGAELAPRLARRSPADRRRIQMVFQNPDATLNPSHTVRTVLTRALATLAGPGGPAPLDRLTERVRIDPELLDRRPAQLSGGQKQRVAIARSFAGEPDLVVCDEPVSSLDASVQATVLELLAEQRDRTGTSYLFISHDLAVVGYLADRVAVMYRGRIVEQGPTADVLHGPSHPYTELLLTAAARTRGEAGAAGSRNGAAGGFGLGEATGGGGPGEAAGGRTRGEGAGADRGGARGAGAGRAADGRGAGDDPGSGGWGSGGDLGSGGGWGSGVDLGSRGPGTGAGASSRGCPFADRCAYRIEGVCAEIAPPERRVGRAHVLRCHLDVAALPVPPSASRAAPESAAP